MIIIIWRMVWIMIWVWGNENGNDGIGLRKMKTILSFGEMETNDELKTKEIIKWMMRNDFQMIGLSFWFTWRNDLWIAELGFQKIQITINWESEWEICLIIMNDDKLKCYQLKKFSLMVIMNSFGKHLKTSKVENFNS